VSRGEWEVSAHVSSPSILPRRIGPRLSLEYLSHTTAEIFDNVSLGLRSSLAATRPFIPSTKEKGEPPGTLTATPNQPASDTEPVSQSTCITSVSDIRSNRHSYRHGIRQIQRRQIRQRTQRQTRQHYTQSRRCTGNGRQRGRVTP
jgi:hypothetical protein